MVGQIYKRSWSSSANWPYPRRYQSRRPNRRTSPWIFAWIYGKQQRVHPFRSDGCSFRRVHLCRLNIPAKGCLCSDWAEDKNTRGFLSKISWIRWLPSLGHRYFKRSWSGSWLLKPCACSGQWVNVLGSFVFESRMAGKISKCFATTKIKIW